MTDQRVTKFFAETLPRKNAQLTQKLAKERDEARMFNGKRETLLKQLESQKEECHSRMIEACQQLHELNASKLETMQQFMLNRVRYEEIYGTVGTNNGTDFE